MARACRLVGSVTSVIGMPLTNLTSAANVKLPESTMSCKYPPRFGSVICDSTRGDEGAVMSTEVVLFT